MQVSRDLNHEEEQYLRDLNLIIHVFRRRFEIVFGTDDKVTDKFYESFIAYELKKKRYVLFGMPYFNWVIFIYILQKFQTIFFFTEISYRKYSS